MLRLCLITAVCLFLHASQQQSIRVSANDGHLKRYLQILENYGIDGSASGANQFLNSLIPDEKNRLEIDRLIGQLSSSTYLSREAAEKNLITRGPAALNQLRLASDQGDTETRCRARRCIATIELTHQQLMTTALEVLKLDKSEIPVSKARLRTVLRLLNQNMDQKRQLTEAPRHFVDASCQDEIRKAIKNGNRDVRIACVLTLAACFPEDKLKTFLHLIENDDAQIANAAVETIGFLQPDLAANRLVENLYSEDQSVRKKSSSLLRTISHKYFGYRADGSTHDRRGAAAKWKNWVSDNAPLQPQHFENLVSSVSSEPTGFLVSVSGASVHHYDLDGRQIWQLQVGVYDAQYVSENELIIAERNRNLVRVIDRTGETQVRIENVNSPSDVEILPNGNVLALSSAGRLYEFGDGKLLKTFTGLSNPFDADRLPNGDTIVADSGNNRILIYDPHGKIIWQKGELQFPNNVFRAPDGRIAYTTYTSGDVVMLSADGTELWRHHVPGSTLYSVYVSASQIYVADGSNSKIWILNLDGKPIRSLDIPLRFCDVDFIAE